MRHDQERKMLLHHAAHAMLSPLNSLHSMTGIILHGIDGRINAKVRRDVEEIVHDASELHTRLEAMIVVLRLEGEMPDFEPLVVSEAIQGAAAQLELPEGMDYPIHIQVGANVKEIWADRTLFDVLLQKSLQHVTRVAEKGPISVTVSYGRGQFRFWIMAGDPSQVLVRTALTEIPNRQLRHLSSIDLMICRRLVEVHGGTLGACKRPGQEVSGLCFSLPKDPRRQKT